MPSATLQASSAAAIAAIASPFDLTFLDEDDAGTARSSPPPPQPPPRSKSLAPPAPPSPPQSPTAPAVPAAAEDSPNYMLPPRTPLPPSRMRICWFPDDEDGDTAASAGNLSDGDEPELDSSPMSAAWPLSSTSAAAAAGSAGAPPVETDADSSRLSSGSSTLDPAAGPASSASGFRPRHRPVADPVRLAFLTAYKLNQSIGTDIRLARVVLMQNMLEMIYLSWSDILPQLVDAAAAAASLPTVSDLASPNEGPFDVPLAALLSPSDTVSVTSTAKEARKPKGPLRHVSPDDIDDDDNTPLSKIGAGAATTTNRSQTRSRASAAAGVASAFSHIAALLSSARRRSAADSDASSTSVSTETSALPPANTAADTAASAGPKLRHRTSMASIRSETSAASLPAYGVSRPRRRRRTPAASPAPSPAPSSAADPASPRTSGSRSAAASPVSSSRVPSPRLSGVGTRIRGLLRIPAQGANIAAAPTTASILPADDDPRLLAGDVRRRRHSDSDADPDGAAAAIWSYQLKLAVSSAAISSPTPGAEEPSLPSTLATPALSASVDTAAAAAAAAARSPFIVTPAAAPTADAAVQTDPVEDGDIVWLPDAGSSTSTTTAAAAADPTFGSDTASRPRPLSDLLLSFAPDELADLASLTQFAASGAAWPLATLELQERDAIATDTPLPRRRSSRGGAAAAAAAAAVAQGVARRAPAAPDAAAATASASSRSSRRSSVASAASGASSPPQSPTAASPVLLQRMHRVARSFDAVTAAAAASPAFRDDYPGARAAVAAAAAGGAPPVVPSRRSSRNWQDLPAPVLRTLATSSSSASSSSSAASAFSFAPSATSDGSTSTSAPTSTASSPPDLPARLTAPASAAA
ncbi:hypothetical protein HK405_011250, partial [Cladochytrium tenue]